MQKERYTDYSPYEEKINIISHTIALVLSIIGLFFLITRAATHPGNIHNIISVGIFGISMILLYAASASYHYSRNPVIRKKLHIFDHAAIYILISGTYTPFTVITLHSVTGWVIFTVSWCMALTGIILKLFFTGKYNLISTVMYVVMGWIIIFAIKPLFNNLSSEGIIWLFAGGISYTAGAVLYGIEKIPFNHAVFHIFVLTGSICHFISVYFYVLPA